MPVAPGICFVAGLAKNGATAKLWSSARFASPPEKDTPLPSGDPTASRLTSTADGGDGTYRFPGVTPGLWYVSLEYNGSIFYDTHDIKNPLAAPTVKDYGAVGDGLTDDTTAVQAALNDTAQGLIVFPQGSYLCGNLTISNRSNFVVEGQGGAIVWTGTAGAGDQIGIRLSGVNSNVTIRHLEFLGDGVAANGHAGVWWKNGDSPASLRVEDCWIRNCARGVSGVRTSSGTWNDLAVTGCFFDTIVGTSAGQGEGVYLETNAGASINATIEGNTFSLTQQYAVHLSRGLGAIVRGNQIVNHRSAVASGAVKAAVRVNRFREVVIEGNRFSTTFDGCIEVTPTTGTTTKLVTIRGNQMVDAGNAVAEITIGTTTPASDGAPEEILLDGNQLYRSAYRNAMMLDLRAGLRVGVRDNLFVHLGVTGTPQMISLGGYQDGAGARAYSDLIDVAANTFYGTTSGGGTLVAITLETAFCTSIARLGLRANRMDVSASFVVGASVTNPNVTIADQPNDGLTFDATAQSATLGIGRLVLAGTRSTQASLASAAGRHGFAQASPTSIGHFGGALAWPLPSTAKTADYVMLETDGTIKVDTTAANRAVTLPDPATCPGRIMVVKRVTAGGNSLTVAGAAGNVDGGASVSISANNECWGFQSDGVGWWSIFTK
jgi:Pectate lyase superfamily protein